MMYRSLNYDGRDVSAKLGEDHQQLIHCALGRLGLVEKAGLETNRQSSWVFRKDVNFSIKSTPNHALIVNGCLELSGV